MNPQSPREELEIRITALLMGELSPEEAAVMQTQIAADAELSALHTRLQRAMGLLREASAIPEQPAPPVPARLSDARRARLLAHFKGAKPGPVIVKPRRDWRRDWKWAVPLGLAASLMALIGGAMYVNGFGLRKGSAGASTADFFESDGEGLSAELPAEKQRVDSRFAQRGTTIAGAKSSAAWGSQPGMVRVDPTKDEGRASGDTGRYYRFVEGTELRDTTAGAPPSARVANGTGAIYLPSAAADHFAMSVVEPHSISEPLPTGGKVDLNYALAPFSKPPSPQDGAAGVEADQSVATGNSSFVAGSFWDTPRTQTYFDRSTNGDVNGRSYRGGLATSKPDGTAPSAPMPAGEIAAANSFATNSELTKHAHGLSEETIRDASNPLRGLALGSLDKAGGGMDQSGGRPAVSIARAKSSPETNAPIARAEMLGWGESEAVDLQKSHTAAGRGFALNENGEKPPALDPNATSDAAGVTKAGGGTVVLSGASSYAGGTTISGGVLQEGDKKSSADAAQRNGKPGYYKGPAESAPDVYFLADKKDSDARLAQRDGAVNLKKLADNEAAPGGREARGKLDTALGDFSDGLSAGKADDRRAEERKGVVAAAPEEASKKRDSSGPALGVMNETGAHSEFAVTNALPPLPATATPPPLSEPTKGLKPEMETDELKRSVANPVPAAPAGRTDLATDGGVITGAGTTLNKNGLGTWQMTGANTFTGGTTLNGGTLALDAGKTPGKPAAGWEEFDFQAGVPFNFSKLSLHDGSVRNSETGVGKTPDASFTFGTATVATGERAAGDKNNNALRGTGDVTRDLGSPVAESVPQVAEPVPASGPETAEKAQRDRIRFSSSLSDVSKVTESGTEAMVNREIVRRSLRDDAVKSEAAAGAESLKKKENEAAFSHFKIVSDNIPADAPPAAASRPGAVDGLTKSAVKLAEQRASEGYYASAAETLKEALKQDPNSAEARRMLREIEAPDYYNKQMTPQHRVKVEEVKQAFVEAKGYTDLGRFDLADRKYQEIIERDPYNQAARQGREELANLKMRSSRAGYDATRATALWEVEKEWDRPAKRLNRSAGEGKDDQKKNGAQEAIPGLDPNDEPQAAASGKGNDATQQKFVEAFLSVKKGEELEKASDLKNAQAKYREVVASLEQIKKDSPGWQQDLVDFRLKRTTEAAQRVEQQLAAAAAEEAKRAEAKRAEEERAAAEKAAADKAAVEKAAKEKEAEKLREAEQAAPNPVPNPLVPQPEVRTGENAFSTFSLNVSDVAFKLAAASLERGMMPDVSTLRTEEFINAFDYRDPEPAPGAPLAFVSERARYPFAQNRDLVRFSVKTAAAGRQPGKPLNVVLLLDNSGSMERADRVRIVRAGLRTLSAQLTPQDKLSIVTFSRTPRLWADGVAGDKAGEVTARVGEITPEGGTNLAAALDLGYKTALRHYQPGSINHVVLLTDGAANLGDVDPAALKQKVEAHRKQGIALDCFGIGWEGLNDDMLEQLSRNGDGRYGFINTPEEAATNFAAQLAGALRVAASDVKVQVEWNPKRVTAYRQVGYAKHQLTKEQFRDNTVDAAELAAAESGNALYVIEVNPRGEGDLATVRVRFKVPGTSDYREHEWAVPFMCAAPPLENSSSTLRLAGTAAAFSEMLASSPFATEVTSERLLGLLNGVPAIHGADPRPKKLEWMIRQAKSLSGR